MKHNLKIWPQFYDRVADGSKTFEVRDNDRHFQRGDILCLQEWDPSASNPVGGKPKGYVLNPARPDLEFEVGYIYVLDRDRVILSLLKIDKPKKVSKPQKD